MVGIDLRSIKILQAVVVFFINYLSVYTFLKNTGGEGERMLSSSGSYFGLVSVEFAHTTSLALDCQWKGFPE